MAAFARRRETPGPIPQSLLVVRGARHYAEAIRTLLTMRTTGGTDNPGRNGQPLEQRLKLDCMASLSTNPLNSYDPNAIEVTVNNELVGHIAKEFAPLVKPYLVSQQKFECTILWNGDAEEGYEFFTVQLFS